MAEFFEAVWALRWVLIVGVGIWLAASAVVYPPVWDRLTGTIRRWLGVS